MGATESMNDPHTTTSDEQVELNLPVDLPVELTGKYEVVDIIGKGAFGSVYKVRNKITGGIYAAKHLKNTVNNKEEVRLQADIHDEHVVRVYDTIESSDYIIIIMEYCEGGNLLEWIKRNRRHDNLNEKVILQMLLEICEAVHSCHLKKIIHRDIKPENILLDSRRRVKLGDFGVARRLNKSSIATSFCGTPPYMAPELFLSYLSNPIGYSQSSVGYDNKCDVWSIGCILYDMCNVKNRFVYHLQTSLGFDVAKSSSDSISEKDIVELIDSDVPSEYSISRKLLHQMLVKSAAHRISLSQVLQDTELRKSLENPVDGHWSDVLNKNV